MQLKKVWQCCQEIIEPKSAIRGLPHFPRRGALSYWLEVAHEEWPWRNNGHNFQNAVAKARGQIICVVGNLWGTFLWSLSTSNQNTILNCCIILHLWSPIITYILSVFVHFSYKESYNEHLLSIFFSCVELMDQRVLFQGSWWTLSNCFQIRHRYC